MSMAVVHGRARGSRPGEEVPAAVLFLILAAIPLVTSGYVVYILPQYMLYGILAMSLALLWGNVGILSFGQAAFFALGGYALGIAMKQPLGVNPAYVGLLVALAAAALVAGLVGWFLFSAGVRDSYFVLVTLALSIIAEQIAVSQSQWTGGWNGLFLMRMTLTLGSALEYPLYEDIPAYYAVLLVMVVTYTALRGLTRSRFGKILAGIRENESRMTSLGISTSLYKTLAFSVSAAVASLSGALYGMHSGFVSPSLGGVLFSTEIVVWVAIAGRSSLLAALIGGIAVSSISNLMSAITPQYWQLCIGILFIVVIAYFRGGVAAALPSLVERFRSQP
ncbi:MAG TPA: branched-chain amino acid ABC transporter permease [Azospirillum sp.]|nr:branched-chain amino acid ABC transporter permease [Azospirillum sp.]